MVLVRVELDLFLQFSIPFNMNKDNQISTMQVKTIKSYKQRMNDIHPAL